MNLLELFKNYLFSQDKKASNVTVKNYLSDINHFFRWFEDKYSQPFNPKSVTKQVIDAYKLDSSTVFSSSSLERHLSSLRKLFKFLILEGKISRSPFEQLIATDQKKESDPWHIKDFKNFLYVYNASRLTIKNYLIDIKQFLSWTEQNLPSTLYPLSSDRDALKVINPELIENYKQLLIEQRHFSPATINRKLSSLRKYLAWASEENLIAPLDVVTTNVERPKLETNLPEAVKTQQPQIEEIEATQEYSTFPPLRLAQKVSNVILFVVDEALTSPLAKLMERVNYALWKIKGQPVFAQLKAKNLKPKKQMGNRQWSMVNGQSLLGISNIRKEVYAPELISTKYFPWYKKLWFNARYNRPKWYKTYHSYPIAHYFHFAILIVFIVALCFGFYNAFFQPGKQTPTLAAGPTAPPRILSFQGRLTDNFDNPITSATWLRFAIYNDLTASGSALLWQETDYIAPDQDGIFNVILGNNTAIPSTLFSQNSALWLGVTVQTTPELTPRQPLATVAFATNAEFLQGMAPITDTRNGTLTSNTILALDSLGNLTIGGSANPTFQASGGQFKLLGQPLILGTNPGSNSNVSIAPDGLGQIDLQKPVFNSTNNNNIAIAQGAVEIDDMLAILATSSGGRPAFTLNQNGSGPLIAASTSGISKFTIDNSGNMFNAGAATVSGNLLVGGTTTFGGVTYAWPGSGNGYLQNTGGTLSWATIATYLNLWQELNGALSPLQASDDLLLGGSTTASAAFAFTGLMNNTASGNHQTQASFSGQFIVMPNNGYGGKVGIGTTNPTAVLDVAGTASFGGQITFRSTFGTIQTTAFQNLTLGGNTTGNIVLAPFNGIAGANVAPSTNGNVDLGTSANQWRNIYANGLILPTTATLGGFWQRNSGALSPTNIKDDLLIGSISTSSALFSFSGVATGQTIASVSGNLIVMPNNGYGGNVGIGTTSPQGTLHVASTNNGANDDLIVNQAGTTNLITNPSFETNTTGWAQFWGGGGTIVRSTNQAKFGSASGIYTHTSAETGLASPDISTTISGATAGLIYTAQAWYYAEGSVIGRTGRLSIGEIGGASGASYHNGSTVTLVAGWNKLTVTATITQNDRTSLLVLPSVTNAQQNDYWYLDGVQLETGSTATPYADGSLGPGYYWNGASNASTSTRTAGAVFAYQTINSAGGIGAASRSNFPTLQIDQDGTGDLFTASASGWTKFIVANNGALTSAAYTNAGGILYTSTSGLIGQTGVGTAGQCLVGGTIPGWSSCSAAANNFWQRIGGALSPLTSSDDLLLGSSSTSSAAFAFTGLMGNQTQASFSGQLIVMPNNGYGGNVGIGTTAPTQMLHLANTGNAGILLQGDTDNDVGEIGTGFIQFSQDAGAVKAILGTIQSAGVDSLGNSYTNALNNSTLLGTQNAFPLQLGTNNAVAMTILSGGNIGIGTTAPLATLQVTGTGYFSGDIAVASMSAIPATYNNMNILPNPSFEVGTATNYDGWTSAASGGTVTRTFDGVSNHDGAYGMQLDVTTAGTGQAYIYASRQPVSPSTTYTLSTWAKVNTACGDGFYLRAYWKDQWGNNISVSDPYANSGAVTTSWTLYKGNVTSPSNAYSVVIYVFNFQPNNACTMYVDQASFRQNIDGNFLVNAIDVSNSIFQSDYQSDNGLLLNLPFSETAGTTVYDRGPHGTDGTLTSYGAGGSLPTFTTGRSGNALSFTGTGGATSTDASAVNVQLNSTQTSSTALTWETWIYSTNISADQIFFAKSGGSANYFRITSSHLYVYFTDGNGAHALAGTTTLQSNTWYHVAATYDPSGSMNIYLNGELDSTLSLTASSLSFTGATFLIGTYNTLGNYSFGGKLDEVRIYSRALSADDIRMQYLRGLQPSTILADKFRVLDLNNDVNFLINNSGNVGIGTTSPLATLDVRGNSGTLAVASVSGQTSFAALVANNNGVGDLFTASASGWTRFQINNNGDLLPGRNLTQNIGSPTLQWNNIYAGNFYQNGTLLNLTNYWQRNSGAISPFNITDDLLIGETSTATAKFAFTGLSTNQTQASMSGNLIVMPNNGFGGRVGIGLTNPATSLDIYSPNNYGDPSTDYATTLANSSFRLGADNSGTKLMMGLLTGGTGYWLQSEHTSVGVVYLALNPAGGNVGIGTTSPQEVLHVTDTHVVYNAGTIAYGNGNMVIQGTDTTRTVGNGAALAFSVPANTDGTNVWEQGRILVTPDNALNGNASGRMYLQTRFYGGSTWDWQNNLVLTSSGNVGIRTTSPLATLDVRGNSGTLAVASVSGQTFFAALVANNNGVGDLFTASASGWTRFAITNAGAFNLKGLFGNSGDCLKSGGSATTAVSWGACGTGSSGSSFWQELIGALSPIQSSDDLLLGGSSTNSALFSFTGLATGTTQASMSGNLIVMPNLNSLGGMVGIGTTTPQALLNISSASNAALLLQSDTGRASYNYNSYLKLVKTTPAGVNITDIIGTVGNDGRSPEDFNTYTNSLQNALLIGTTNAYSLQLGTNNAVYATLNSAGKFGLGVNYPRTNFDLVGSASFSADMVFNGSGNSTYNVTHNINLFDAGSLSFNAYGGGAGSGGTTNILFIAKSGNVGIGTNSPEERLHVYGAIALNRGIFSDFITGATIHDPRLYASSNTGSSFPFTQTGNLIIQPRVSSYVGSNIAFVTNNNSNVDTRMVINYLGNVGIGTTAPLVTLDVRGNSGTLSVASFSGKTSFAALVANNDGVGDLFTASASGWTRFVIQNNGNVGIGTTTPGASLDVAGTTGKVATFASAGGVNDQNYIAVGGRAYFGYDGSGQSAVVQGISGKGINFNVNNSTFGSGTAMTILSDGNVGIGTTAPNTQLVVKGATGVNTVLALDTTDALGARANFIDFRFAGTEKGFVGYGSSVSSVFYINSDGTNPIALNSAGGNVGIGTTTPRATLDVNGDASTSGVLTLARSAGTAANILVLNGNDLNFSTSVGGGTGTVKMVLTNAGQLQASSFYDFENTGYYLDPAASGTSLQTNGGIIVGPSGTGKLTATTLDPLYTIDGTRYATYAPSMTGVKEEVSGRANLTYDPIRQAYAYVLNLNNQPVGSDVWLFSRVVDIDVSLTDVLLTPNSSAKTWYEKDTANRTIVFYSDRPTGLSFRLTAPRFDHEHWGNISNELDPSIGGMVAPVAQTDTWPGISSPSGQLGGPFQFTIVNLFDEQGNETFALVDSLNNVIKIVQEYSDLLAANIEAGLVNAEKITTNSLSVASENISINGQNIKDYIASIVRDVLSGANNTVISPIAEFDELHTNFVSPVGNNANIGLKLENNQLSILNGNSATASAVSSFDNQGNASFSGQLSSNSLNTNEATISGTLHAGRIIADQIEGLQVQATTVSAQYITNIYNASPSAGTNFGLIANSGTPATGSSLFDNFGQNSGNYISIASYSSQFAYVENLDAAIAAFSQGLMVFGPTSLSDTSIVGELSVNGSLILADNSINVLGSDLNLQPLRQGGLSIMGGLVTIDTYGNLKVGGSAEFAKDVTVKGTLAAGVISPLPGNDLTVNLGETNSLSVKGASNSAVLSVNPLGDLVASGAATIAKLNLSLVEPALAVSPSEIIATGSAGTAQIVPYQTQVTIDNNLITEKSLIYITPVGTTFDQNIYLLRQTPQDDANDVKASFTVGVNSPLPSAVKFNYLIVN